MALRPERAPSSLASPGTSARRCKYHAFLSFRGEDTRKGFVSHLYKALEGHGFSIFMDDQEFEGGEPFSRELSSAIEYSYFAIVVLSPNYASSSWCLDELSKIVQCMGPKDSILPIFYYVDPSDVRKQLGSFAKAFEEHERKFISTQGREKVKQWKADLAKVANLKGWHSQNYKYESEIIEDIVKCVRGKVQTTFQLLDSPDKFVQRDSALNRLSELLDLGANDVRFIWITGMGGIGKTIFAHRVCDINSQHFDVHCFLKNVREVSGKGEGDDLQNQLLFTIYKEKNVEFWDARCKAFSIRHGFRNKKVLLVLDDVDHRGQLQELAGDIDWFGNGSRIIITTRSQQPLVKLDRIFLYEVKGMNDGEALELFSLKAFQKVQPDEEDLKLSEHFVRYAKGLPLALTVWGSLLSVTRREEWNSVLDNLQNIPHHDVFNSLKISYDGLEEEVKKIFLDIACFHKGKAKKQVIDILDRRFDNISSESVIGTLIGRSLLTMSNHNDLEMHDLIQDMGRKIVLRESDNAGERTRIWHFNDFHDVLTNNTGTEAIQAIVVNSPKLEEIQCDYNGFLSMRGLRHIEFHDVKIVSSAPIWPQRFLRMIHWRLYPWDPICLPPSLRIISWDFFSLKFLPQSFLTRNLTELRMPRSKLVRLWDGRMDSPNLKIMDLGGSDKLTTTPDFTGMPNLEKLQFWGCVNLVDIHSSIAVLKRLKVLNFEGCKRIKSLPSKLEMDSLEEHDLRVCSKLKKVPEFSKQMKTLSQLRLSGSAIEQLPSSIGNLLSLQVLNLKRTAIEQLPSSIGNLVGLTHLNLSWTAIKQLPSSIGNLVDLSDLDLERTALEQLPSSIGNLVGLRKLNLGTTAIEQLPSSIGNLVGLRNLNLRRTALKQLPSSIGNLVDLFDLDLERTALEQLPSSIGNLVGLRNLNLRKSVIEQLPSSIGNLVGLINLYLEGYKRLCVADLNQHLNHFRCLELLDLSNCNLGEGAIPEDIGCLSSLQFLDLSYNHFVTLPASIQFLSIIHCLCLYRCEMLRELPPLPTTYFYLIVQNCTSLQRLTDPSKLSSKLANLYDFDLNSLNCVRLVEDEGFINYVCSKMVRWITNGITHNEPVYSPPTSSKVHEFTYPASEIPEWFVNKSEEAGDWLGVAFCFVGAREIPGLYLSARIEWSSGLFRPLYMMLKGHRGPEHVTMFYQSRKHCRKECPEAAEAEFSVDKGEYYDEASKSMKVGVNMVKWAARWVYKQDLIDLQQRLKVLKRTHEYYGEEAGPSGSDAISDDEEPNCKRQKKDWAPLDIESE